MVRPVGHDCLFNGAGERFSNAPWGLAGGEPGGRGRFALLDGSGAETPLEIKPSGVIVRDGEGLRVETPGAGGFGSPS